MRLAGQGEMHLRVALERLAARFGVAVEARQDRRSAYRETIRDSVTVRGRHKKQSGGHGQFGDVVLEVAPLPRGEGFVFDGDGAWRRRCRASTSPRSRPGCATPCQRGPLGFPVVDVAVTLIDGSYHTVDSSDMAFRTAARVAHGRGAAEGAARAAGADPGGRDRRPDGCDVARHRHRLGAARPDPRL